jgi:hypothetical protein
MSVGIGAARLKAKHDHLIYTLHGDGELKVKLGSVMAHKKVDNRYYR